MKVLVFGVWDVLRESEGALDTLDCKQTNALDLEILLVTRTFKIKFLTSHNARNPNVEIM